MSNNKMKKYGIFESIQNNFENNKNFRIIIFFIALLIFCFVYIQAPLYRSNQHTKFLHGLAKADYGFLKNDWLAKTIDPLPAFSFVVYFTVKFLNEYIFYLYFIIILGVYVYSIINISFDIFNFKNSFLKTFIFFTIFTIMHSTLVFDSLSYKIFDFRLIELFFEEGVAAQYMIGRAFQPCVFGVFIILSIFLFLKNKYYWSIFFLAFASTFHTAYLFSSGILTLTYMIIIYKEERKLFKPFLIGLISLILILPVTVYHFTALKATSPELSKIALDILVKARIPHHADPKLWLNIGAYLKFVIICIAIFIIRKSRLFLILLIPFITTIFFTITQLFIDIDFIGFLAPWRVTVWLVPISTCIIIGYILLKIFNKYIVLINHYEKLFITLCSVLLILFFIIGISIVIKNFNLYLNKDHGPMMNYVSKNKSETDIYLIPDNMLDFRINTGVPILITYKSHPYKDVELIEWYERLKTVILYYDTNNTNKFEILKKIKSKYNITHVVLEKEQFNYKLDSLKELYKDDEYGIYKLEF